MQATALIHGGNYDSTAWRFVVPHLTTPAILIDLPGRGRRPAVLPEVQVEDFVAAAREDIEASGADEVVLVAHSAGGLTAAHLVNRIPDRISHVVLVSCTVPPHGTAIVDHIDPDVREAVLAGSGDGTYVIDDETATKILCNDLDDEMSGIALREMLPDTTNYLSTPIDLSGLKAHPRVTYVRTLEDMTLPLAQQDAAIAAIGDITVVDLRAGHMSLLSRPAELAQIITAAAAA